MKKMILPARPTQSYAISFPNVIRPPPPLKLGSILQKLILSLQ